MGLIGGIAGGVGALTGILGHKEQKDQAKGQADSLGAALGLYQKAGQTAMGGKAAMSQLDTLKQIYELVGSQTKAAKKHHKSQLRKGLSDAQDQGQKWQADALQRAKASGMSGTSVQDSLQRAAGNDTTRLMQDARAQYSGNLAGLEMQGLQQGMSALGGISQFYGGQTNALMGAQQNQAAAMLNQGPVQTPSALGSAASGIGAGFGLFDLLGGFGKK